MTLPVNTVSPDCARIPAAIRQAAHHMPILIPFFFIFLFRFYPQSIHVPDETHIELIVVLLHAVPPNTVSIINEHTGKIKARIP